MSENNEEISESDIISDNSCLNSIESDSEENPGIEELRNLTQKQLNELIRENQEEICKCQELNVKNKLELELLERDQCKNDWTADEEHHIKCKRRQVREHAINLGKLKERCELLKKVLPKYQTFDVKTLPQVILCDQWQTENLMPKIVVCPKPSRATSIKKKKQDRETTTCLTAQQLQLIENEKRCIELECGQLQLQIAGVKGQARVISNENNKLRAIIGRGTDSGASQKLPCSRTKGAKTTVMCPIYKKPSKPVLQIDIASKALDAAESYATTEDTNLLEELQKIENKCKKLEAQLAEAKQREGTMKAQQEALHCVKEAFK